MLLKWNRIGLALAVVLVTPAVRVRTHTVEKETAAVVELGAAGNCNVKDGSGSFDPDVAVEVTPIRNWLELEAGVTPLFARHSTEWDTDLLFKRPWDFSPKVEFMAGIGPEWIHSHATATEVAFPADRDSRARQRYSGKIGTDISASPHGSSGRQVDGCVKPRSDREKSPKHLPTSVFWIVYGIHTSG
jgi:hypothetical protein